MEGRRKKSVRTMGEVYYSPPTVTHLKKQGGNIIQNCDIYIRNAVKNSSWDLEELKWCDPFHQRWDLSLKERRKKYRGYVTSKPELMRSLSELRGKCWAVSVRVRIHVTAMFWLNWSEKHSVRKKIIAQRHPRGTFTTLKVLFPPCPISTQLS